ncbi:hypothetical protein H6503_01975 [Candidatus Woesearchaeota archaeon]|nr:hypothetical protein [Candidatus Woesearchaeota archaeon]
MVVNKLFHNVHASVFIKEEEDYDAIKAGFLKIFPWNLRDAKILLMEKSVSTFNERKISILEVTVERNRQINELIAHILSKLSHSNIMMLLEQLPTRVDDDGNFFFRLSKSRILQEKPEYMIVDDGDCYHFKCHVASFPQSKENSIKIVQEYLSSSN